MAVPGEPYGEQEEVCVAAAECVGPLTGVCESTGVCSE